MNSDEHKSQIKNLSSLSSKNGVNIISASEIEPEHIDWMWDGWLARGKVHILAGPSTSGKTHIAIDIAATLSNGGTGNVFWPDKSLAPSGNVLIWSGEDSIKETILPRLIAAGANRKKINFIKDVIKFNRLRQFDFKTDCSDLSQKIDEYENIDLIIIDPIISSITGNSNSNASVRNSLEKLNSICERHNCAILGIHHFNKGSKGKDPLERVSGSLAFGAFPRVVMVAAKVQGDGQPSSVLVRAKATNSNSSGGFEYHIEQKIITSGGKEYTTSCIRWSDMPLHGSASEILSFAENGNHGEKFKATLEAESFLLEKLSNGKVLSAEIRKMATENGISKTALKDAEQSLHIEHVKATGVGHGPWFMTLPNKIKTQTIDASEADAKTPQLNSNSEYLKQKRREIGLLTIERLSRC